jgi:hypothetical protein
MPSRKRPSELRALNWTVIGLPFLMFAVMLKLAEGPACKLLKMIQVQCWLAPEVPDVVYEISFGVATVCLILSAYRAYRDFYKGDFEVDLAIWSGSAARRKEPTKTARFREAAMTPAIALTGKEWADEIRKQLETMLAEHEPVQATQLACSMPLKDTSHSGTAATSPPSS